MAHACFAYSQHGLDPQYPICLPVPQNLGPVPRASSKPWTKQGVLHLTSPKSRLKQYYHWPKCDWHFILQTFSEHRITFCFSLCTRCWELNYHQNVSTVFNLKVVVLCLLRFLITRAWVLQVGLLPCRKLTWVLSPALHIIPQSLPVVISEGRARNIAECDPQTKQTKGLLSFIGSLK